MIITCSFRPCAATSCSHNPHCRALGCADGSGGARGGMMTPRRFSTLAALCGTVAFAGWAVAGFADFGWSGTEDMDAAPMADGRDAGVAHAAMAHADLAQAGMAAVVLPGTWREPLFEGSPVDV